MTPDCGRPHQAREAVAKRGLGGYHVAAVLKFLHDLIERGRVRVAPVGARADRAEEAGEVEAAIRGVDAVVRTELPGEAPPLSLPVALWALALVEDACRFFAYRDVEADAIAAGLGRPCPLPPSAATCYSADLFLRYLPDLIRLAGGLATEDPLVGGLRALARQWPLSSVGVPGVRDRDIQIAAFFGDPSLRQLYVDRILERRDTGRLGSPGVHEAVSVALGAHPELAPGIGEAPPALPQRKE